MRVPKSQQKAEKLLEKIYQQHPDLLKSDTLVQTDTIYLPETTIDTVLRFVPGDTVVLRDAKTGTKVRVRVDTVQKTVYIGLDQSPTVIRQRQTINQKTIIRVNDWWDWWFRNAWIPIGLLAALVFFLLFLFRAIFPR